MKQSLQVARIFGIPIEINYSWIVIFILITWSLASGYYPLFLPSRQEYVYWLAAGISAILLFVSLLLHELSHSLVAIRNGIPIKKISLFIFGGVAQMEKEPDTSVIELKIAIAGPACSLFIALICLAAFVVLNRTNAHPMVTSMVFYIAIVNMSIVVFNSIPGFPLDGGRILRAMIWKFNNNLKTATRIATYLGRFFSYAIMLAGLFFLSQKEYLSGIWLLVLGLFLHEAAEMSYQQLILKKALVGVQVKEIMSEDVISVPPDLSLDKLVNDYFFKHRHMGFPVVDNGLLKGIVTLHSVKEFPRDQWSSTSVFQALTPVRQDLVVCPESDCLEALLQVTKSGLGRLLVVDHGRLVGIITQRGLVRFFEIKTHLCS
ncbi:MAG: site-2 protease family protein [Candidatus Margulisiibacteriota bacterium]